MAAGVSFQLLESLLTPGRITLLALLFTVSAFIVDFTWKPRYDKSLPRVGNGDGLVGTIKNWFGYVVHFNDWVDEGYEKYSKNDRSFVVHSAPSRPAEIVIPRSQTAWMLELPERILSTAEAHADVLYGHHQFLGVDDHFPISTIHKHLARNLVGLIPGVQDEIESAIDATFGKDTEEWKSLNLWEVWMAIVPRVTSRIVVGAPVCRDETFLKSQVAFADAVVRNSFILNMFPRILHPVVAPLAVLPNWWHWYKSYRVLKPVIEQRLQKMEGGGGGGEEMEEDMITWLIRQAEIEGRPHAPRLTPALISKMMLPVEFAAIHTTAITGHTLMLDLLSSDPKLGYLDTIREETSKVLKEEGKGGRWSKNTLTSLFKTDSAIRESMRLSHFATALTHRKVIAKEGITNPVEGWHAPYGSFMMLNLAGVHHDEDIYENPNTYDAFRFSRAREELEAGEKEGNSEDLLKAKKLGMVTTSDTYLPFSHGRHACPGRFFVAHELKMILAYLLQNYDIKPLAERPKPMWIGQTIVPPIQATVELRRRKGTV
ncbi:cytochrome P450 [Diplogelasinospora grovesii]|uniref:Cytochrome P450 n=1 Tax=Diplogelasinospora grovesii TaxID=303347 RepID=A0AAN6S8Z4_9PEZI|nr:cytochrome P450 [Diplogelasinospora grovesii]